MPQPVKTEYWSQKELDKLAKKRGIVNYPTWTEEELEKFALERGTKVFPEWTAEDDEELPGPDNESNLILCSNCGYALQPDWDVCPICNTRTIPSDSNNQPIGIKNLLSNQQQQFKSISKIKKKKSKKTNSISQKTLNSERIPASEYTQTEITPPPEQELSSEIGHQKDHIGLNIGDTLNIDDQSYRILKQIASGGFSLIYKVEHILSHQIFIIKCFKVQAFSGFSDPLAQCELYWNRERKITEIQQRSPWPSMHYHGQLKLNVNSMSEFYLLFEYIEGPTLSDWYPTVHSLSESLAENQIKFLIDEIILPLTQHLYYVHQQGIIHRDVTLKNILIRTTAKNTIEPILIDWGMAKEIPLNHIFNPHASYFTQESVTDTTISNQGTPPELRKGLEPISASDVYMLAHIMFFLFNRCILKEVPANIAEYTIQPYQCDSNLPSEIPELLSQMTQYEPADRLPINQIIEKLQDLAQKLNA